MTTADKGEANWNAFIIYSCNNTECWVWEYLTDDGKTRPNSCPCCNVLGSITWPGVTSGKSEQL